MAIGTSMGAYYDDEFHHAAAGWDNKYDDNEVTPFQMDQNKQLNQVEQTELGGLEVDLRTQQQMPFPNNNNPDTDFNSRFGNLPPSGILNDIKPQPEKPLSRKL